MIQFIVNSFTLSLANAIISSSSARFSQLKLLPLCIVPSNKSPLLLYFKSNLAILNPSNVLLNSFNLCGGSL